ncbi:MAG: MobA/MobL family protein, partial [Lachnospiraceae bacterium]|nr:MobA/MobL family protein [Lachnospiraceae bacterium]
GMCVDMNIHDKGDGNPHCHIMLTMRGLDENGKWLPKSHQEFELDENGERIRQADGRWKSRKVNTVDWSNPENAERWRASWAETVNRHLEQNGIEERIDHRSNAARGLDEIPSIHMGPAACAMEKKGFRTERGDINRQIRAANRIIKDIRAKIGELKLWLTALSDAMKEIMEEAKSPNLTDLLTQYIETEKRRVQKYSDTFRLKHIVSLYEGVEKSIEELNAKGIHTLDDLEAAFKEVKDKSFTLNRSVKGKETRMKELQKMMDMGRQYQQNAPIRKQYNSIKREKKKEAFAEEHRTELSLWNAANRYLHAKHIALDSFPEKLEEWQNELDDLSAAHKEQLEELK